jgi:ATP-dependent 26S proteasome regulatory subunit
MTSAGEDKRIAVDASGSQATGVAGLPEWFPGWAHELAELYFSGTTSMFVVHGNTFDFTLVGEDEARYGALSEFLAEQVFGRWELVLHYDLARGLRCLAGRSSERLKAMVALANRRIADLAALPKEAHTTLAVLDRFVLKNVMADEKDRLSVAIIIDHASYLVPRGDRGGTHASRNLVTLLNWASSPYVKRLNMAFLLVDPRLADVAERLTSNPHVASISVNLPEEDERRRFLDHAVGAREVSTFSDFELPEVARLTAGISLADLNVMVQSSLEGGRRLDRERFQELKKRLIERQAQGMLEFIEPRWGLDMVVGHEAAKGRLRDDADLLGRGALDSVPMGYLICGPVGTGKSFLAQCAAGAIGIPCVKLKNFRSKYVGETEGNLERVLSVLRSMGPVVVIVDEADAMLGDRDQSGDSGVGSRVFGMIAAQMGDTRFRGRILWMLLTARPDLLPIDLKRQGRAEVHIPLFYPHTQEEIRDLFLVMARKLGASLAAQDVPGVPHAGHLSGADIEGIVGRAWRIALLSGGETITREAVAKAANGFMPSTQSLERELQEIAAIIECTDREFLPAPQLRLMEQMGGRQKLQERLTALRQIVEAL